MKRIIMLIIFGFVITSCSDDKIEKKGFQVNEITEDESGEKIVGLSIDSLKLETQPRNVLLTFNPAHRLTPLYKVNYNKKTRKPFTGSNAFHKKWNDEHEVGNNWNQHLMPGFEAVYGYNFINVSHHNSLTKNQNNFFQKPVLIKTLYYPAPTKDTLNFQPVKRDFYMVSVYDEDTNKDGFLNVKDLRRFYHFDINGVYQKAFVPKNYSVMSSEYDFDNDFMYVFARKDINQNGQMEVTEPINIFWIDLKNPENYGTQYLNE